MTEQPMPPDRSPFPLQVLIADDNQETRRSTRLMLSLVSGVKVVAIAHNGRQAVELARQHEPDIALIDINMPGPSGLEAIRQMLQNQPEIACIIISAERQRRTLEEAMRVGARDYLIKPFTSDQLMIAIRRISQVVIANRQQYERTASLRRQRDTYLLALAEEYRHSRRTDDKARRVYEALAANPNCERRWLVTLAMVYVLQGEWARLRWLAARLEEGGRRAWGVEGSGDGGND